eukprot:CAMPEP_0172528320 /NCGR_PEP_ID=MMETSP1067-20121228/2753_1 /TAXON_ID=265564 ORGANISM="Thalassiosira punctigera, Strain Tpunct2005C2" /NCGR_SAMPLE_ID=MMETSP1067 /ASSEMBLY_ACC=CAM_ASM_000444 /LENGTH=108 /DNA_ID=CAMNT_0013312211 /DNA_START=355 /DNA_END=678 /DNA_ORIENTATION=+
MRFLLLGPSDTKVPPRFSLLLGKLAVISVVVLVVIRVLVLGGAAELLPDPPDLPPLLLPDPPDLPPLLLPDPPDLPPLPLWLPPDLPPLLLPEPPDFPDLPLLEESSP